eukprot:8430840-Ditylum_brightwellii.AAC.1
MKLSKEKIWDEVGLSCWHGCNADYENTVEAPGIEELATKAFGIGPSVSIELLTFKTHVTHESTKGETETESTSIGFSLGDDDS